MRPGMTALATVIALCGTAAGASADTINSRVGKLEMTGGYPTDSTIKKLYDERDFQRAAQAYIWALPIVGMANWQRLTRRHSAQSLAMSLSTTTL